MRPDRSRVLLAPEMGSAPGYEKGGLRVILVDDDRSALFADELVNFIAKCVAGGVPIHLSWGDGPFAKRALVNDVARDAIGDGNKTAFIAALRELLDALAQQVAMDKLTEQNRVRS